VQVTQYSGHAIELAEKMDLDAHEAVVCYSGDGVLHEVFNGLAKRLDGTKALKIMPGGSGNGMCMNPAASAATL
jgi:sphingosine kinase